MSSESQRIVELEADNAKLKLDLLEANASLASCKITITRLRSRLSDLHYTTCQCSGGDCHLICYYEDMCDCDSCGGCFCDDCWSFCESCKNRLCFECMREHKDKCRSTDPKSENEEGA